MKAKDEWGGGRLNGLRGCVCIISECGVEATRRGFCNKHFMRFYRAGKFTRRHGLRKSVEYKIWLGVKIRCFYKGADNYERYGGRGITMDIEWAVSFKRFFEDVGVRPGKLFDLDRENPDGNYEPGNCRWLDRDLNNARKRKPGEVVKEVEPF